MRLSTLTCVVCSLLQASCATGTELEGAPDATSNESAAGASAREEIEAGEAEIEATSEALYSLPTCYRQAPLDTGHIGPIDVPSAGTTPSSTRCIMRLGTNNAAVRRLQGNLNVCFDGAEKLAQDGDFGPKTRDALKRTQHALMINADGVYGPETRDAMPWWAGGAGCWLVVGP